MSPTVEDILRVATFKSDQVDAVLSPHQRSWVKFDPELGYLPANIVMADGIDGSLTRYSYETLGNRTMTHWRDHPCRINTFGDSYTQCQQVSDGETWQEYLAGHIGEPVRNFGVGGYGVIQAIRRAMRTEESGCGAEYVVVNVFDDDHIRNLDAARWIRTAWRCRDLPASAPDQFHGLPWCHLRYDLGNRKFVEMPGVCQSSDELRRLCDPNEFRSTFKDDQIVRLYALQHGISTAVEDLEQLAAAFDLDVNLRDETTTEFDARRLHLAYGLRSTMYVLDRFNKYLRLRGKHLIVLLSYGDRRLTEFLMRGERFDQPFIDYLASREIRFIDGLKKHHTDFTELGIEANTYLARYFIQPAGAAVFGHYSPAGNHFFAFAIKKSLVAWLDPRPAPYRHL